MQVHDNLGFKFRSSHYNSAGTVKGDKLCMDASETRVVVSECLLVYLSGVFAFLKQDTYVSCSPGGRHNQPEGVGVHPGGGGPRQPGHRHRPPCQDDPTKVDNYTAWPRFSFVNLQVTDIDDEADEVHSRNGAGCSASVAF